MITGLRADEWGFRLNDEPRGTPENEAWLSICDRNGGEVFDITLAEAIERISQINSDSDLKAWYDEYMFDIVMEYYEFKEMVTDDHWSTYP